MALPISAHLAQFLIIKEVTDNIQVIINIYKRDTLTMEILDIGWIAVIPTEMSNPDELFNLSFNKIDTLVNQYIPLRKQFMTLVWQNIFEIPLIRIIYLVESLLTTRMLLIQLIIKLY